MRTPRPLRIDPSHPVGGAVLRAIDGSTVAIDDAAAALQAAEQDIGLGVMLLPRYEDFPDAEYGLSDASIAAFLDATAFVIDGAAMQLPFALVDPELRVHDLSFRDWAHQVAAWPTDPSRPLAVWAIRARRARHARARSATPPVLTTGSTSTSTCTAT